MSMVEGIVKAVRAELSRAATRTVVAVTGPQGSGKTTASQKAATALSSEHDIPTLSLSLDDFYYPHQTLQDIAARGNPLLRRRGLPGTHDVKLLVEFLQDFKSGKTQLRVPTFDKGRYGGEGDRGTWVDVPPQTRAILLEGWMVGFRPVPEDIIEAVDDELKTKQLSAFPSVKDLVEINRNLAGYEPVWDNYDCLARLAPQNLDFVYTWREQQEHDLIARTGCGMKDAEVRQFVDQYMPCYYLYNRTLPVNGGGGVYILDHHHRVLHTR